MCNCSSSISNNSVFDKYKKKSSTTTSSSQESVCGYMYNELLELDLKAIELLKDHSDSILTQMSAQLRTWIRNLKNECPESNELEIITEYINNEYSEYNP